MIHSFCTITCPYCMENFEMASPALSEVPTEWDYDCEICCRPMVLHFSTDGEEVVADAVIDQ